MATKKMIFAISTETIATPAKPSTPAISATMRKVTAQPSMVQSSLSERNVGRTFRTASARKTFALEKGSGRPFDRRYAEPGRNQGSRVPSVRNTGERLSTAKRVLNTVWPEACLARVLVRKPLSAMRPRGEIHFRAAMWL